MSINLIELAQEYFSDTVIEKISSSLGLEKDTAANAIGRIFPSLMGFFGDKAQTPEGATHLFDTIREADTGILYNLSETFTGDNTAIIDKGQGVLSSLLGGKFDYLTDIFSKIPGLTDGKAGGLMGLLTPVLTGILGKQVKTRCLNASGLTSLLDDQKVHISEYLGDFTSKLGLGSFFSGAGASASGAIGSVKSTTCDLAGDTSHTVGGAVNSAKYVAGSAVSAVTGAAGAAKGVAGDAVGPVGGAVSGAEGVAKGAAGSAAGSVGGAAAAGVVTAEKAGGGLMKLLPIAGVGLLAFFGFKMCSGDSDTSSVDKITSATDDLKSTVGGVVSESGSAVSDIVGGAVDSTGNALNSTGSAVGGAVDSTGNALNSAGSAVSDTVGGAVGGVVDSAGNALNSAGSAVSDTVGGAVGGAVDSAGNALNSASSVVSDTVGGAVNSAGNVLNSAGSTGSDAVDGALGATGGAVSEGTTELPSFVPTPDAEDLSEKATALAQKLTRIEIPEGADIDELYAQLNTGDDSNFLYRITFATGETGVPEAHRKALIEKLQSADPTATLVTIGYADTRGDDAQNKLLSYGRAKEVGAWIKTVSKDSNLESFSMGETDRFSRTEFSKNRVVEVWQIK